MKALAKKVLPPSVAGKLLKVRSRLQVAGEFRSDRRRYVRHSLPGEVSHVRLGSRNLEAQLIKDYHRIEKGLALPEPRRPFGKAVSARITSNAPLGVAAGTSDSVLLFAYEAQEALTGWNEQGEIEDLIAPVSSTHTGVLPEPEHFFGSRHSVRDFGGDEVSRDILDRAVALSLRSPSVCNRQAWHVRFYVDGDVQRVLSYQNGNSGFSHTVPVVALVTVDSRMFAAPGERNQPWVEGGIFSMTLVWALHALGLDSCMLNMSVGNRRAVRLRKELKIPDHELVVMMIAIGYGRENHRIARSPRRSVTEVAGYPSRS